MSTNPTANWKQSLDNLDQNDPVAISQLHDSIRETVLQQPSAINSLVQEFANVEQGKEQLVLPLISAFCNAVSQSCRAESTMSLMQTNVSVSGLTTLIDKVTDDKVRLQLIRLLAVLETEDSLTAFAGEILNHTPAQESDVLAVFEPLFASKSFDPNVLFPNIFTALDQPKVASAIIDLANYVVRSEITAVHPIVDRLPEMRKLLAHLTIGLEKLEANPNKQQDDPLVIAEAVEDSSALVIALCDAFALAGDVEAISVLQETKSLAHRRIRVEACAALARLGEEPAVEELVALAAEPSMRTRVLKYAEELGLLDEIDPKYQTDVAVAESRLCMWLAQPRQMGITPTSCELVDNRTYFWPGYDEPVECFLFRFVYSFGNREYSNIGITGPMTHAFTGNLNDLPVDAMYAAFAGWQSEHEEIEQFEIATLNTHFQTDVARLERSLNDRGYEEIESSLFGRFFGQNVLVCSAERDNTVGQVVIGSDVDELWFPHPELQTPLTAEEVYHVYKGKQLLNAFND